MYYVKCYQKYLPNVAPTRKPFIPKLILAIPPTTKPAVA